MKKNFFIWTSGVLLALACSGCFKKNPSPDGKEAKEEGIPVEVAPIVRGRIESSIKTSIQLEAEEEVKVFARTSNRVTELLVEEGDLVEKDQLLLRLEDDIQQNQYEKAKVKCEKSRQEFARQKALFEQKLISEQVFNDAEFDLKQLELALADAERELEYTKVRAPISGTVARRLVKNGELVNINQHLFDLIDFESIVAKIYVPENHLAVLEKDLPARITVPALAGRQFAGYVKRISPIVEAKTGTVKVTIGFMEIGPLRPGMFVDVELVTVVRPQALLISKRALVLDGEQMFVFRLLPDRKVERILVQPRVMDQNHVEPLSGFEEGDEIVVAGQAGLKNGAKVRLPGDPDPADKQDVATANGGKKS